MEDFTTPPPHHQTHTQSLGGREAAATTNRALAANIHKSLMFIEGTMMKCKSAVFHPCGSDRAATINLLNYSINL